MCEDAHTYLFKKVSFLSGLQLSTIPQRCCLESASRAASILPLRCGTLHMCYSSHSDLPMCTMLSCLLEDRAIVKYRFPFEMHSCSLPSKREKSYPCWNGREKGLCMPSTIVVLISESSREGCCSEEIKAVAFPRAVHLH